MKTDSIFDKYFDNETDYGFIEEIIESKRLDKTIVTVLTCDKCSEGQRWNYTFCTSDNYDREKEYLYHLNNCSKCLLFLKTKYYETGFKELLDIIEKIINGEYYFSRKGITLENLHPEIKKELSPVLLDKLLKPNNFTPKNITLTQKPMESTNNDDFSIAKTFAEDNELTAFDIYCTNEFEKVFKQYKTSGIYIICSLNHDKNIIPVYVGKSVNIKNRWNWHHRHNDINLIRKVSRLILFVLAETEFLQFRDLDQTESILIERLNPILNREHKPY